MRRVHGGRELLNLPGHHSTAAIVAEVEDTGDWPKNHAPNGETYEPYNIEPHIICKITDCDSAVNIDFDVRTANQLENALHKIDVMRDALTLMREGLIVEHHRLHDRVPSIPNDRRGGRYGVNGATRSTILPSES